MEALMTALSPETRRLLDLSRDGDDPSPVSEHAVRTRLIGHLGVTAMMGVTTASVAASAAEAAGAASAASQVSAGMAGATLAKTVTALVLAAGVGAGVWKGEEIPAQAVAWGAAVSVSAKETVKRAWNVLTSKSPDTETNAHPASAHTLASPVGSDEYRHQRLMEVARRPNRPVAKEAELVLILGAEGALADGDAERAARYLDVHEVRFRAGVLAEDREALRAAIERARGSASPNF
jgi:hypothetical protein